MKKVIAILAIIAVLGTLKAYGAFETTLYPYPVYSSNNSTSTPLAAYTLQASDVVGYFTLQINPTVQSVTLSLPASTTLSNWLSVSGSRTTIFLLNSTSTAGINIGIIGNTGSLVSNASTTATTTPGKAMRLDAIRKSNTDFLWVLEPSI